MRVEYIVPFVASLTIGQVTPAAVPLGEAHVSRSTLVAQAAPASSGGITVLGRSVRTVKADTVVFVANVQIGANGDPATTGNAIVAALKRDGIADAAWNIQNLNAHYGSINVSGSSPLQPADALEKIFKDAALVAGSAVSQNIQLNLQIRNCTAVLDALRQDALDDARRQAQKIADALGVRIGGPTSANATAFNTGDRCPSENGAYVGNTGGLGAGQWTPDGMVTLSSGITVTYAIAK
jgi:uncharacterized protein YggE